MNPEVEVADRVAALIGTTLTETDVHRFLLDAADTLGTESFAVYGPDRRIVLVRELLQPRLPH